MNEHDSSPVSTRDPSAKRFADEHELPTDPYNERIEPRLMEACRRSELPPRFDDETSVHDPKALEASLESLRSPKVPNIERSTKSQGWTVVIGVFLLFICIGATIALTLLHRLPKNIFTW